MLKMVAECAQTCWCDFLVIEKMGPTKLVCL